MVNKKSITKLMALAGLISWAWLSFVSADQAIGVSDILAVIWTPIVNVYFWDNWNDFWWMLMISGLSTGNYNVQAGDHTYTCTSQLRWWYYNVERWERAWPLASSMNFSNWENVEGLTTDGWIYTSCTKDSVWWVTYAEAQGECNTAYAEDEIARNECLNEKEDMYSAEDSYYGVVTHEYKWKKYALVAWVEYDHDIAWISIKNDTKLIPSLISLLDNTREPVGFLYDYNWWIWMSNCKCSADTLNTLATSLWDDWIKPMINTEENEDWDITWSRNEDYGNCSCWDDALGIRWNALGVVIEGLVWRTRSNDVRDSYFDPKMQIFSSVNVNNATLINFTKQKAEALCRWRWHMNTNPGTTTSDRVVCIQYDYYNPDLMIDASSYRTANKTLIVKNWNVVVNPVKDRGEADDDKYYDIFIDNWNLIIDETAYEPAKFVFNNAWFISDKTKEEFETAVHEANDLYLLYTWTDAVAVWVLLKWNFIVWWNVLWSSDGNVLNNKYFLYGKFTSKDGYGSLGDVFVWTCEGNLWSDGNLCPHCEDGDCPKESRNYHADAPLVVIDQNYDSPLFW